MKLVITGSCGLTGSILLNKISVSEAINNVEVIALVRETTNRKPIENLDLNLNYHIGEALLAVR
jgi:thioester reductase-like protein